VPSPPHARSSVRASLVAVLVAASALVLATPARSAVAPVAPPHTAFAPRFAPHVPGVGRYDGRIPSSVRRVIVVTASRWRTTYATLMLYRRTSTGWHRDAAWPARLGYGGLVIGDQRVQDTGTTPAGLYSITSAFGRSTNPGTRLPYTRVSSDQWWVEDRRSRYYNEMRLGSQGGFALRTTGYNSSEHLVDFGRQYDYAAVIDFNRPYPVVGRGAGIFLHVSGSGATGGCVSIRRDRMAATLRWLDPRDHPVIVIGPSSWLAG
jgi:L,D-peptidoglycan transpeptidase YkuD (ErfK/YbiS/YcfS/YnhG family)